MNNKKVLSCALAAVMTMQGGGVVFAEENNLTKTYSAKFANDNYQSYLKKMIDNGYIEVTYDNELLISEKYKVLVESRLSNNFHVRTYKNSISICNCKDEFEGETKFVWTWKGFDLYLDHNLCRNIEDAAELTAAISVILLDITLLDPIIAGVATSVVLIRRQDLGRGVIIAFAGLVPHWVSSQ